MNPNQPKNTSVKFNDEAIEAIYEGVNEVCEATATTLGPLGRNVLIDKDFKTVIIHDGVSVANSINPSEPYKKNGARVIQEAAKKQRDEVGDGTTAVMILTKAILDGALKATGSGTNPMLLKSGLESGSKKAIQAIEKLSKPIKTLEQKIQIASISAQDNDLGKLIAETIHDIGDDGVLTVDKSKAADTTVEKQKGMQIDKGIVNNFLMTDPDKMRAVLEDCYVLVTDIPLNEITTIGKFLENTIFPNTKKCLFISPEIGTDFIAVLIGAKLQGQFLGLGMRAPGLASMQTDMLQDICALTGATFITKEANHKFEDFGFEALGHAHRIIQSKTSTIIEGGAGNKKDISERITVIKGQMKEEDLSDYEREQLKARHARLTNGVAVIKIGGQTEVEMDERYERADDAVRATQAACKYGMIPGGEIVYLSAINELNESNVGENILREALKAPFKRLVENAGYDSGEKLALKNITVDEKAFKANDIGFDVTDGTYKDMVKAGIIDPTAVPTNAIKTAVSVAVKLSSLGAAIVLNNEEKK